MKINNIRIVIDVNHLFLKEIKIGHYSLEILRRKKILC
jgi:hypothetical protein